MYVNKTGKRAAAIGALSFMALASVASIAPAAHANGTAPDGAAPSTPYTYDVTTTFTNTGATKNSMSGGNTIDQDVVATDLGQIANVVLTRYTPALVVVAIAGTVLIAGGAAVRMVKGGLTGSFH